MRTIEPYYTEGDVSDFFTTNDAQIYERLHVSIFQRRKQLNFPSVLIGVASEMPDGAFIGGGFMRSLFEPSYLKDIDVFFHNAESLIEMVRRIHNAPEGTTLHGYSSTMSLNDMLDSNSHSIVFVHADPAKVPIELHRVRWFDSPELMMDKSDVRFAMASIDCNLNLIYSSAAFDDARNKRLVVMGNRLELGTAMRVRRLSNEGWSWWSSRFDSYHRGDLVRMAESYVATLTRDATRRGVPAPIITNATGAFLF